MNNRAVGGLRGGGGNYSHGFDVIASVSNLFRAWNEFKQGKTKKQDVASFAVDLEDSLFRLHDNLIAGVYRHSSYQEFYVFDPKRRHISKASVADRLVHHAIFRVLEPVYDLKFILDSYSSRREKGIHKAHERFWNFARKLSQNNTRTVWVLKCDIRKFFDSVDHAILIKILSKTIKDEKTVDLLKGIIVSFKTKEGKGIPLGNLTSQLFSNVYLDVLDQYIKRQLRVKYYIRYADDFVLLDIDRESLVRLLWQINLFLREELCLSVHPDKVYIRKFSQGIDFLGYVIFPHHKVLRTKTKKRILRKIEKLNADFNGAVITQKTFDHSMASYYGLLKHCRGEGIRRKIWSVLDCGA